MMVDAMSLSALFPTRHREKSRVPEMHQTRRCQQWHFGMKAHIGVDEATGLVLQMDVRIIAAECLQATVQQSQHHPTGTPHQPSPAIQTKRRFRPLL